MDKQKFIKYLKDETDRLYEQIRDLDEYDYETHQQYSAMIDEIDAILDIVEDGYFDCGSNDS